MNLKNLAMWAIIVLLTVGLYNMFKNPQGSFNQKNNIIFSEFLSEVENGRVVQVEIQGNNVNGVFSNGQKFSTYVPNDPNLIEKLSERGVSISASPLKEKNAFTFWYIIIMVSNVAFNCSLDFLYETDARWKRWSNGFWKI